MNLFEQALRNKYRFPSTKGTLSTEDLFDLPLTSKNGVSLDSVAKAVNRQLIQETEESFVEESSQSNKELVLKLNILRHIIKVRKEENQARADALANAQRKAKIQEILERKKDGVLEEASIEELQKMLKEEE